MAKTDEDGQKETGENKSQRYDVRVYLYIPLATTWSDLVTSSGHLYVKVRIDPTEFDEESEFWKVFVTAKPQDPSYPPVDPDCFCCSAPFCLGHEALACILIHMRCV